MGKNQLLLYSQLLFSYETIRDNHGMKISLNQKQILGMILRGMSSGGRSDRRNLWERKLDGGPIGKIHGIEILQEIGFFQS